MEQKYNKATPKILLCCILTLIILMVISGFYFVKTLNYEKVEAHIIGVYSKKPRDSGTKTHYITYEFLFNGQKYQATKQVFTSIGKREGALSSVRCNPNNPTELFNTLLIQGCLVGIVILVLVIFILIRQIHPQLFITTTKET